MNIGKQRFREADPIEAKTGGIEELIQDPSKVIVADKILSNLKKISDTYTDEVSRQANEYADRVTSTDFDSDEDLLGKAKDSLDAIYGEKKRKTESLTTEKLDTLDKKKSDYLSDRTRKLEETADRYDKAEAANLESLTKKGMLHSSVAELTAEQLASNRDKALDDVKATYDRKLETVERKIDRLNAAYDEAMKNYEITYAIELEDKLNKLKQKRDRLVEDYDKTHTNERRDAYNAYLAEEESRNKDREGDYTGAKRENYQERYNYLIGELEGKDKTRVANFIKENETALKAYLGLYYDAFVEEVS